MRVTRSMYVCSIQARACMQAGVWACMCACVHATNDNDREIDVFGSAT